MLAPHEVTSGHCIPVKVSLSSRVCGDSPSVALAPKTSTLLRRWLCSQSVQWDDFTLAQPEHCHLLSSVCGPEALVGHPPCEGREEGFPRAAFVFACFNAALCLFSTPGCPSVPNSVSHPSSSPDLSIGTNFLNCEFRKTVNLREKPRGSRTCPCLIPRPRCSPSHFPAQAKNYFCVFSLDFLVFNNSDSDLTREELEIQGDGYI